MAENCENSEDKPSKFWCAAPGCTSDGRKKKRLDVYPWMKGVLFFPFPGEVKNPSERRRWLDHLRRPLSYKPKKYHRVCSRHFVDGRPTSENPYPTLFSRNNYGMSAQRSSTALEKRKSLCDQEEQRCSEDSKHPDHVAEKENTRPGSNFTHDASAATDDSLVHVLCDTPIPVQVVTVVTSETDLTTAVDVYLAPAQSQVHNVHREDVNRDHAYTNCQRTERHPDLRESSMQTDLSGQDLYDMEQRMVSLQGQLGDKQKIQREIFVENVVKNDENVNRYTGVPSVSLLNGLFDILNADSTVKYWSGQKSASTKSYQIKNCRKPGPARKLSRYEEFILTLVRFRLGIVAFFLGDIFGISTSRVSQIFITWMNLMNDVLSPLIKTPSRRKVKKYMPLSFRSTFPKTTSIIDCTEIYVQKPRSPKAQAQTYSTYKSSNTFKALVSITPTGAFNFISNLWGGNTSDRFITKECGFLDSVLPGDEIMADRGFTIRDLLTERHATLNIPPFTRKCTWGKGKRLNAREIQRTKQIARLRIHVERAIGRMKTFRIISGVIPLKLKAVANQMLKIAAFLCNLHKPLVR